MRLGRPLGRPGGPGALLRRLGQNRVGRSGLGQLLRRRLAVHIASGRVGLRWVLQSGCATRHEATSFSGRLGTPSIPSLGDETTVRIRASGQGPNEQGSGGPTLGLIRSKREDTRLVFQHAERVRRRVRCHRTSAQRGSRERDRADRSQGRVRPHHGRTRPRGPVAAPEVAPRHRWRARSSSTRAVARAFYTCLRNLESKSASRAASRWGAVLGTAAVGSVSASEMLARQEGALEGLLQSGVPAMLEVGSALKSAQAWEIEAGLIYDELAWFLYDELWDVSASARPELSPAERRDQIDLLLDPLIDSAVNDGHRAGLVVHIFLAVLAARLAPVFEGLPHDPPGRPRLIGRHDPTSRDIDCAASASAAVQAASGSRVSTEDHGNIVPRCGVR